MNVLIKILQKYFSTYNVTTHGYWLHITIKTKEEHKAGFYFNIYAKKIKTNGKNTEYKINKSDIKILEHYENK